MRKLPLPSLKIRPINKRAGSLPKNTEGQTLLLFACDDRRVIGYHVYLNNKTMGNLAPIGFSHYAIIPTYLI
jgi:hypothetical protein